MVWIKWRWAILGLSLVLFLTAGYFSDKMVQGDVADLKELSEGLGVAVETNNWLGVDHAYAAIDAAWPPIRRRWDLRMHRDEMDDMDLALVRLGGYVEEKDQAGIASELSAWQMLLTHITHKEIFQWRNLL